MDRWHRRISSPLGELMLVADRTGLCGLYFENHVHPPRYIGDSDTGDEVLDRATSELAEYFSGVRQRFGVPISLLGTDFQRSVWDLLLQIPYGETRTYRGLADRLDNPMAIRAVGAAVGRNPISIIVPCHRVVGSDGDLTGFAGGVDRKRWLLAHEKPNQGTLF